MASAKPPLTLNKMAVETDIDKSYLSKLLRGQKRMHLEHIDTIAKVLGVSQASLFKSR